MYLLYIILYKYIFIYLIYTYIKHYICIYIINILCIIYYIYKINTHTGEKRLLSPTDLDLNCARESQPAFCSAKL